MFRSSGTVLVALLGLFLALCSEGAVRQSEIQDSQRQEVDLPEPSEEESLDDATAEFTLWSAEDSETVVPKLLGDGWTRFADYPLGVSEAQGATLELNGRTYLFVTGGYLHGTNYDVTNVTYSFELFDGVSDTQWIRRADMPKTLTHVAQVAVGSKLYTCGGFLGKHPGPSVRDCFVYDLASDSWKSLPSLPHRRAGGGIVYIEKWNALFFAGGALRKAGEEHGIDFDDSYLLRLGKEAQGWTQMASFQNPRNHLSAVEVDGRYFFVGGQHQANEETGNQKSLNEYVPMENKWYKRADMPYGIGHLSASTPRWGGGFLVIGGVQDRRAKSDDILFYDMLNNSWVEVGKYERAVQTPVCGLTQETIFCSTGAGDIGDWFDSYMRPVGHLAE